MTTERSGFVRARRPEQKQQRTAAMLDAARKLALRDGVGAVTLAAIAAEVGVHKTALLKYFGTREEIFLRLVEEQWRDWASGTVADLGTGPADDERVVEALTRSFTDRPLFCQLLSHAALTLEHNVSLDAARRSKTAMGQALTEVADTLCRALPWLDRGSCLHLLTSSGLMAAGLWQVTHPPPVVVALAAESPALVRLGGVAPLSFTDGLTRFMQVHLAGLRSGVTAGAPLPRSTGS